MSKKSEITLKLDEVLALNMELAEMLREPEVSFTTKYHLVKLFERTKEIVKPFNQMKLDIFKKYGSEDPERPGFYNTDRATTEDREAAQKEIDKLIEQEETFKGYSFKMKEFENVKSGVGYVQFFKFIVM
jgi:hypothetical protein